MGGLFLHKLGSFPDWLIVTSMTAPIATMIGRVYIRYAIHRGHELCILIVPLTAYVLFAI